MLVERKIIQNLYPYMMLVKAFIYEIMFFIKFILPMFQRKIFFSRNLF